MDIIQILKEDYQKFPVNQTYSVYAENVYFQDPLNKFRGVWRYKLMIKFMETFFLNPKMDLYAIKKEGNMIKTEWTLSWNTPVPWKPRISIPGWSELQINDDLIISHIDYWHCSPLDVIKQHLKMKNS